MVKRDVCFSIEDGSRLVGWLIEVAYPPSRFATVELGVLLDVFNDLLTCHPEFHARDARVFGFHQSLIVEHERRAEAEPVGGMPGQLDFGDMAPVVFGVEVAY